MYWPIKWVSREELQEMYPMPRTSIKEWIYTAHMPSEVLASFEKLFALPETWRKDARSLHDGGTLLISDAFASDLEAILEGKD